MDINKLEVGQVYLYQGLKAVVMNLDFNDDVNNVRISYQDSVLWVNNETLSKVNN